MGRRSVSRSKDDGVERDAAHPPISHRHATCSLDPNEGTSGYLVSPAPRQENPEDEEEADDPCHAGARARSRTVPTAKEGAHRPDSGSI